MSARADFRSASRQGLTAKGGRASVAALAFIALVASSPPALALKIPIQASLSGGGEVPSEQQSRQGTDGRNVRHRHRYADLDGHLLGLVQPRRSRAHFHGPVSYLGLTPEENAPIQVGTPGNLASPFHGVAKIDDTQAKDLKDGRWYFNLHSKDFPAGEIRGPVVRR